MEKIIKLFDEIQNLDGWDMMKLESGDKDDYSYIFEPLEEILKEFYLYENKGEDDFKQKVMEFYNK